MGKVYYVTPGPDAWEVEILDEDPSEGEDPEEPPVILGGGWIGAEKYVIHRAVLTRHPDGSLEAEGSSRSVLRKTVQRRRPWWS